MIRKIKVDEAKTVQQLINKAASKNQLLERSLNHIYDNLRDYWVYIQDQKILGCCGLHVVGWQSLAEIKSLVVVENFRKKNIGKRLVKKAVEEAKNLGIEKVFALTFSVDFFTKIGFKLINKNDLPHKIWTECLNCTYFPECKEEAVIIDL
ncbi:MAG: N-acetyltransferase [Candidatus Omnitrophica bacterium]|nr:N-acetyltransferase [Candidatus Omnitrophota bacterium]